MDEFQRRLLVGSCLWATVATLFVGAALSTLAEIGIPPEDFPHGLGIGGSWGCFFVVWFLVSAIAMRRYR
jgi:hypothetical protein